MFFRKQSLSEYIYSEFKRFKKMRSGSDHYDAHIRLQLMMRIEQEALYELVFSGKVKDKDLHDIIFFGGQTGSVAKERNLHWIPFLKRVRERQSELPLDIQSHLEWLGKVHHYWD